MPILARVASSNSRKELNVISSAIKKVKHNVRKSKIIEIKY